MVCADIAGVPRSTVAPSSIAGGFVLVPVPALMAAWRACRVRPLGIGDFRAWLAAHEMVGRRGRAEEGRAPAYSFAELAGLLGITQKRARASASRLVDAGLLEWAESAIGFPQPPGEFDPSLEDSIGGGRGSLAIPRRILRHLAGGARPALVAAAMSILLRCLSRRRAGFDGRGRVKAAWIADVFGVDLRRAKQARRELLGLGWIHPEPSGQRAENRWGRAFRIDLGWDRPGRVEGRSLPPLPPADRPEIATPSVDQDPFQETNQDQEPGPAGPAGARHPGIGPEARTSPEAGPLPPPRLDDVRPEDLADTGRLLGLHGQAAARGLVTASEADRLRFIGAAEHALAVGKANPPGLFVSLVRGRLWRYLTQGDEDAANRRLKAHLHPPHSCPPARGRRPAGPDAPGGPSDAEVVRAVRGAAIGAGIYRDPWPEFARLNPGWTRERWERALG